MQDRSLLSARLPSGWRSTRTRDGSWPIEGDDETGSPATYGEPLATFWRARACHRLTATGFKGAIALADSWLTARQILTVADASVCLMISESIQPRAGNDKQKRCLELLSTGQSGRRRLGPAHSVAPRAFRYRARSARPDEVRTFTECAHNDLARACVPDRPATD